MIDVNKILHSLQHDPGTRKTAATAGAVGAAGLAVGLLSGKKGRKFMGKAAKYGAVAALGGIAYHAWRNRNAPAGAQAEPAAAGAGPSAGAPVSSVPHDAEYEGAPANTAFLPAPDAPEAESHARALVRAMIAAAKADGKVDADEKSALFEQLETMALTPADKAFVFDELAAPLDVNAVASAAQSEEHAAEIYAASLVAIEDDTPAERAYLQALAVKLNLPGDLVNAIHEAAR